MTDFSWGNIFRESRWICLEARAVFLLWSCTLQFDLLQLLIFNILWFIKSNYNFLECDSSVNCPINHWSDTCNRTVGHANKRLNSNFSTIPLNGYKSSEIVIVWLIGNGTCPISLVEADSRLAVVRFRNHSSDYRPNRTPLSPIAIIILLRFASAKKCSNEGRALMQLDFQQYLMKLERLTNLRWVHWFCRQFVARGICREIVLPINFELQFAGKRLFGVWGPSGSNDQGNCANIAVELWPLHPCRFARFPRFCSGARLRVFPRAPFLECAFDLHPWRQLVH